MYCSMCGNVIPMDAKFCAKCGAKNELLFEQELTPEAPTPKAPNPEATNPEATNPEATNPKTPTPKAPNPETPILEAPIPKAPIPKVPILKAPIQEVPIPEAPTPIAPIPNEPVRYPENIPAPKYPGWQPEMIADQTAPATLSAVRKPVNKKSMKALIITAASLFLIALCVGGFLWYSKVFIPDKYDKQLELGEVYLAAQNYDKAIATYHDAIDLLSDREEAHIGLSNTYKAMGEYDQSLTTLETAYENTHSKKIKELIDEFEVELASIDNETLEAISDAVVTEPELDQPTPQVETQEQQVIPVEQETVNIYVRQVDNTNFPYVKFYASVNDLNGESVSELNVGDFNIQEIDSAGNTVDVKINDIYQVISSDQIFVNLVLDKSDSMNEYDKMSQAKSAAKSFVKKVDLGGGDSVEIISFDDYVYLEQEFTSEEKKLTSAINGMQTGGSTALYDAIYTGLLQSYYEDGSKCVIVFTDGQENASSYTWDDVVDMAKNTGIPVFIIGIGADYDEGALTSLAQECSGNYYSAATTDLAQILEEIYFNIYQDTQEYFVFEYESPNSSDTSLFRDILITTSEISKYIGTATKQYVPQADISGDFSALYASIDFMIEDSNVRVVSEADLVGMSLAQLRIARNEIFARHGRQFKDSALNKWFYSKTWYLNIGMKYDPESFDAISPSLLSKLESDNANIIKDYEKLIMENQDIFPDASNELLSDYDLALSKSVLKKALEQMKTYFNSDVLQENLRRVQTAIEQEDISY